MTDATFGILCIIGWLGSSIVIAAMREKIIKEVHRERKKRIRREIMK